MDSMADGVVSVPKSRYSAPEGGKTGTSRPSQPPSPKQLRSEAASSTSSVAANAYEVKTVGYSNGSVINPNKAPNHSAQQEDLISMGKRYQGSSKGKVELGGPKDVLDKPAESSCQNKVSMVEAKPSFQHPVDGSEDFGSSGLPESRSYVLGPVLEGTNLKVCLRSSNLRSGPVQIELFSGLIPDSYADRAADLGWLFVLRTTIISLLVAGCWLLVAGAGVRSFSIQ